MWLGSLLLSVTHASPHIPLTFMLTMLHPRQMLHRPAVHSLAASHPARMLSECPVSALTATALLKLLLCSPQVTSVAPKLKTDAMQVGTPRVGPE